MKRIIVCILLLTLALSACASQDWDPESWFPIWEEAGEPPETQDGVSMEFVRVEPLNMENWPEQDLGQRPQEDWSLLHMKLRLEEEKFVPKTPGWRVDFYYKDAWYTVCRELDGTPQSERLSARARSAGEHDVSFWMPARVLETQGEYRLCYDGHGTFLFTIGR